MESLKSLYKKAEDIDLVVGGSLEKHAPEALIGPTFLCIILKQFYRTRISDRYFFENGMDKNTAFTLRKYCKVLIFVRTYFKLTWLFKQKKKAKKIKIFKFLAQLNSIRKGASMARLLCDNGRDIKHMQRRAYELVSDE